MKIDFEVQNNSFFEQAVKLNEVLGDICDKTAIADERMKNFFENACFLTVEDVMKLTGYSKPTVLSLFNREDFPCFDLGKKKLVSNFAFWSYFMKPVRAEETDYEKY